MSDRDKEYMQHCLSLARRGMGHVAPNPMVGAVLVYEDRIIGEGWHREYGKAHAEVNCINSVSDADKKYISGSVLYVSLEPCAHFGKTPPCADLIIAQRIPRVVIGCRDPFPGVNVKGIEKLQSAGVKVEVGVLEKECKELNKRFLIFHTQCRPYVILKWAQTSDGFIAGPPQSQRLLISNEFTNRLVHKWRSEESAILVGTNTALLDNPELTTRKWEGLNPFRMVVDMDLSLPSGLHLFDQAVPTIVFNAIKHEEQNNLLYYQVTGDVSLVHQILNALYQLKIQSVIVEGGAKLLQSFIDEDAWDEARVITGEWKMENGEWGDAGGLRAPVLKDHCKVESIKLQGDTIEIFRAETSAR